MYMDKSTVHPKYCCVNRPIHHGFTITILNAAEFLKIKGRILVQQLGLSIATTNISGYHSTSYSQRKSSQS